MGKKRAADRREEEALPMAAQLYLSLWGMGVTPEGKQMTVVAAAELAGVSVSSVKRWRERYAGFRELERQARTGVVLGYGQTLARRIVEGLVGPAGKRLAKELQDGEGDWRAGWEVLKAAGQFAQVMDVRQRVEYTAEDMARAAEELAAWERGWSDEVGGVDPGAEQPPD